MSWSWNPFANKKSYEEKGVSRYRFSGMLFFVCDIENTGIFCSNLAFCNAAKFYSVTCLFLENSGRWPNMFFVVVGTRPKCIINVFAWAARINILIFQCHAVTNGIDLRRSPPVRYGLPKRPKIGKNGKIWFGRKGPQIWPGGMVFWVKHHQMVPTKRFLGGQWAAVKFWNVYPPLLRRGEEEQWSEEHLVGRTVTNEVLGEQKYSMHSLQVICSQLLKCQKKMFGFF